MFRRPNPSGPIFGALLLSLTGLLVASQNGFAQKGAAGSPSWTEVQSAHFTVYSDGGEKTAARVAAQFEQIRDVFTKLGKNLRVDPGQPTIILAAKDEKSLAALLPEFYSDKNRAHPSGIFLPRTERNYIVLRTDLDGDFPFATVYHEYTHQVTNLNAAFIPAWFGEGYAEFFGYSKIADRHVSIGLAPLGDLVFLQQSKLLPLEELFRVDRRSPYYNEGKKVNIFYAESWALMHMLFTTPEFRDADLVGAYLRNVNVSHDSLEAARRTFGNLNTLQKRLEAYIRAGTYYHYEMNSPIEEISKAFAVSAPSQAEYAAVLGTYHLAHGETSEGRRLLEQAVAAEPDLIAANEALGTMHANAREFDQAAPYLERAVKLNSKSFLTYYYHGNLLMQSQPGDPSAVAAAEASYSKCVELNVNFAPAYAQLAQIYSRRDETLDKALQAARTAASLEPADWNNQLSLAVVLARRGEFNDARDLADHVAANATEPQEADAAASALTFIADTEQYQGEKRRNEAERAQLSAKPYAADAAALVRRPGIAEIVDATATASAASGAPATAGATAETSAAAVTTAAPVRTYSMLGKISTLECGAAPQVTLTLSLGTLSMKLHAADLAKVQFLSAAGTAPARAVTCAQLRGLSARIQYSLSDGAAGTSGEVYDGEIRSITPMALP